MDDFNKFRPLVFMTALRAETNVILELMSHKKLLKDKQLNIYEIENNSIYLMEIGKGFRAKANLVMSQLEKLNCKLLINYGFCGALDQEILPFNFFSIKRICSIGKKNIEIFSTLSETKAKIQNDFEQKCLLTVAVPVLEEKSRKTYFEQTGCSLVDMEAYRVAHIAGVLSLPILVFKIVSDMADEHSEQFIKYNLTHLKHGLRENIIKVLKILDYG